MKGMEMRSREMRKRVARMVPMGWVEVKVGGLDMEEKVWDDSSDVVVVGESPAATRCLGGGGKRNIANQRRWKRITEI